jgi:4-amino-4-deoxy-L-arabinose transferase-like glycosyltransferase
MRARVEDHNRRRATVALAVILAGALGARLGLAIMTGLNAPPDHRACGADTVDFENYAWSLAEGWGYATPGDHVATAWRPPGYPFFLSILYFLVGHKYWVNRVALALLGTGTCALTYVLGKRLFSDRLVGLLAAGIMAILPLQVYYTAQFMSETLGTFLNVLISLLLADALSSSPDWKRLVRFAVAGLVGGMGALVRAPFVLIPPVVCALLLAGRRMHGKSVVQAVAIMGLGTGIVLAPWVVRNWRVFDRFCLITTNGGTSFWGGNNAVVASPSPYWGDWVDMGVFDRETKRERVWSVPNRVDADHAEWALGMEYLKRNPGKIPVLMVGKFYRVLTPSPNSPNRKFSILVAIGQTFLLPGTVAGFVLLVRRRRNDSRHLFGQCPSPSSV